MSESKNFRTDFFKTGADGLCRFREAFEAASGGWSVQDNEARIGVRGILKNSGSRSTVAENLGRAEAKEMLAEYDSTEQAGAKTAGGTVISAEAWGTARWQHFSKM